MSQEAPPPYESVAAARRTQAVPSTRGAAQRGSVLQSWHEVINILTHPALVVTVTKSNETSKEKQFTIYDVNGNLIAYIEIDRRSSSRLIPGGAFALRVVDPYRRLLLTMSRPYSTARPRLEVFVPDPRTGENVMIGGCQEVFHLFRHRYSMFTGSHRNIPFGRISVDLSSKPSPVENSAGTIVASMDRQWQGLCHKLLSHPNKYVIRMDRSAYSLAERRDLRLGASLSLDQRAVLLAAAIAIDVDYFTPSGTHRNRNAGAIAMMTASAGAPNRNAGVIAMMNASAAASAASSAAAFAASSAASFAASSAGGC